MGEMYERDDRDQQLTEALAAVDRLTTERDEWRAWATEQVNDDPWGIPTVLREELRGMLGGEPPAIAAEHEQLVQDRDEAQAALALMTTERDMYRAAVQAWRGEPIQQRAASNYRAWSWAEGQRAEKEWSAHPLVARLKELMGLEGAPLSQVLDEVRFLRNVSEPWRTRALKTLSEVRRILGAETESEEGMVNQARRMAAALAAEKPRLELTRTRQTLKLVEKISADRLRVLREVPIGFPDPSGKNLQPGTIEWDRRLRYEIESTEQWETEGKAQLKWAQQTGVEHG